MGASEPGFKRPVIETRGAPHREIDVAAYALDRAQQLLLWPPLPGPPYGETVDAARFIGGGMECRLRDARRAGVAPWHGDFRVIRRLERELPAMFPIAETTEATARIAARQATPVDPTGARHERRRVVVTEQRRGRERRILGLVARRSA